jgi:hypothetical protein
MKTTHAPHPLPTPQQPRPPQAKSNHPRAPAPSMMKPKALAHVGHHHHAWKVRSQTRMRLNDRLPSYVGSSVGRTGFTHCLISCFIFFLLCHIFLLRCIYDSSVVYSFGVGSLFASALYSEMALAEAEQSHQTLLDESINILYLDKHYLQTNSLEIS